MGKSNKFSLTTKSHSSTRVNPYDKITSNALNVSCPDKQIVLPKLDGNGIQQVIVELYSLFIFIVALGTQYLNLYRSVWWLSKTRNSQPINYHLIDIDVSQFALIFIGQSLLISILRALLSNTTIPAITLNILAQTPFSSLTSSATPTPTPASNSSESQQQQQPINKQQQQQQVSQQQQATQSASISTTATTTSLNNTTITTVVTATASWICNYYLFKCAYRIWNNFGLNGVSCISYPIVSF